VVSQVKANLAEQCLEILNGDLLSDNDMDDFPDPEFSGELAEEGSSW